MIKPLFTGITCCLSLAIMSTAAVANDKIERQITQDKHYPAVKQKAVNMLMKRGYRVTDIDADDHHGKPALDIDATKNNKKYDIKLSYPSLKIIKLKLDD